MLSVTTVNIVPRTPGTRDGFSQVISRLTVQPVVRVSQSSSQSPPCPPPSPPPSSSALWRHTSFVLVFCKYFVSLIFLLCAISKKKNISCKRMRMLIVSYLPSVWESQNINFKKIIWVNQPIPNFFTSPKTRKILVTKIKLFTMCENKQLYPKRDKKF